MRSCSTSPARRARRAGGAPSADWRGLGIPPRPASAPAFTFIAPRRLSCEPPTRARVRLLGPCFKTGRVGSRHRRRPRALAPPSPSSGDACVAREKPTPRARRRDPPGAHWGQSAPPPPARNPPVAGGGTGRGWESGRTVGGAARPPRGTPARPRGGDPLAEGPRGGGRREGGERGDGSRFLGPGIRRVLLPGGCNTRGVGPPPPPPPPEGGGTERRGPPSHLPRRAFPAVPEPVAAHRRGGNAPGGGRSPAGNVYIAGWFDSQL